MLLAIDPGKQVAGFAVFNSDTKQLVVAGTLDFLDSEEAARDLGETFGYEDGICRIMVERMELRRENLAAVNNIIRLTELAGIFAGACATTGVTSPMGRRCEISYIEPRRWTNMRNKEQNHTRIKARLSSDEKQVLYDALQGVRQTNHKEVLDAIGIGLWTLRRL